MDNIEIRKMLRREFSKTGWALLLYMVLMNLLVPMVCYGSAVVQLVMENPQGFQLNPAALEPYLRYQISNNAWGYLLTALIGGLLMLLWKRKQFCFHEIWKPNLPMTAKDFFSLFCIFVSGQMAFQILATIMESFFNLFGMTIAPSVDNASSVGNTFSMFLYLSVVAPITEEILFRGLVMRSMEPWGRRFAIFTSALLFGVFHGNVIQSPYAFCVGLVLGYTAMEYNIVWSMVLHMANNLLLGDTLTRIGTLISEEASSLIFFLIVFGSTIAAAVILIVKKDDIALYFRMNRTKDRATGAFFTAPGILALILLNLGIVAAGLLSQIL